jgi:hypothetical protein
MTVTYDISTTTGRIRRLVGDTVENDGPMPDGGNFTDAEIAFFYESEGNHVQRGAAAALEALANKWAAYAGRHRMGPEDEESLQSLQFSSQAQQLRDVYGYNRADDDAAASEAGGFSLPMRRSDA